MTLKNQTELPAALVNPWTSADLAAILHERGWLAHSVAIESNSSGADSAAPNAPLLKWMEEAAALLGPHAISTPAGGVDIWASHTVGGDPLAGDRVALADLLSLIFNYDAAGLLAAPQNQTVIVRVGAREVIRELAHRVLDGRGVDSDRFKEIISEIKNALPFRGRELFYPIRLALAGRAGGGELDRVILLLDGAAPLEFAAPVKGSRQRLVEFCAALD